MRGTAHHVRYTHRKEQLAETVFGEIFCAIGTAPASAQGLLGGHVTISNAVRRGPITFGEDCAISHCVIGCDAARMSSASSPNPAALLRLAGAVSIKHHDEWEAGDRRRARVAARACGTLCAQAAEHTGMAGMGAPV